ncbi:hypothetical protein [Amnibacterium kyonggiense]|uniref:Uncharacterized protein n=1 Tax=Amnibacterium kyonggiense TaxID=595671 RepID=A0A4R7FJ89_9MICO|nr:hypothetical protein [Amnibacterium kyonggiense]TDS75866.1 hypothetical protein CLV52_2975 [Amnibacterium kyonggiense]
MTVAPERDAAPQTPHRKDLRLQALVDEPHRRLPALRFPHLHSERLRSSRTSLGTGFIGIAATLVAVLLLSFDLARFVEEWRDQTYAEPGLAALSWLLLAGLLVVLAVAARTAGDVLDSLVSLGIVGGLGIVVALDAAAVWGNGDLGHDLTAAPAAGYVLLAMVGVRSSRSITAASGLLGAALVALLAVNALDATVPPSGLVDGAAMIAKAVAPPIVAAWIVHVFRNIVSAELERVLVASTTSAPRFSVGMMASVELARLDLAAEQLMDGIASGRTRLPLNPATAQAAAELATELRLHLIEGRRQTWLYHAISESELLGRAVTLSDPESLAGLLDPSQRDGLLSAVWLMLGDAPERSRRSATRVAIEITVGPARPIEGKARTMHVPIVVQTTGVARSRVDPATWDAMRKVGRHADSQRGGSLWVEIDCVVDRPAER